MSGRLIERLGELLFPARAVCLGCGDPAGQQEAWLCDRCRARLRPAIHVVYSAAWPEAGVSRAWFAFFYEDPAARLIRSFKYDGVYRLAPFLVECMGPLLEALRMERFDCVMPVPLHDKRRRERGYNQAELIAALVARETGLPLSTAVMRTRNTSRQARLSVDARRNNVMSAFRCDQPLDGLRVLLVDDVFTTGSTANSCAAAIRAAGAGDVQALTVAGSRRYRGHAGMIYRKKPAMNSSKP